MEKSKHAFLWYDLVNVLLVLCVLITPCGTFASCDLTSEDWLRILSGLNTPNFFGFFTSSGDCSTDIASSGLRSTYSDCGITFATVLSKQNLSSTCAVNVSSSFYLGNGVLDTASAETKAIDLCGKTLGTVVSSYLCDPTNVPGCPVAVLIPKFAAVVKCLGMKNFTYEERVAYFNAGDDVTCMVESEFCITFDIFDTCQVGLGDMVDFLYLNNQEECSEFYYGTSDEAARCSQSVQSFYYHYCPPLSFFQQNLIAFSVGIPASVIFLGLFIYCVRRIRSGYISDHEIMDGIHKSMDMKRPKDSAGANIPPRKIVHPELAAIMEKKTKFRGITYDVTTLQWRSNATGKLFPTEMEAAQAAYFAQATNGKSPRFPKNGSALTQQSPSSPNLRKQSPALNQSPIAAYIHPAEEEFYVESEEEKKQRRINQLVNFYEYWDAEKQDIPGHVENLFRRHEFTNIARAVKTKFGLLPAGWEDELAGEV